MKVNDPNLSTLGPAGAPASQDLKTSETVRTSAIGSASGASSASGATAVDDVHLSELVRSLRSMAADSPERQAQIEQLARSYAQGTYRVDSQATASAMIDDASTEG